MNINEKLFDFIKSSPSCFHAITNVAEKLEKAGAKRLVESQKWEIKRGETCFVTRNGSSLIAVRIPEKIDGGFMVTASHSDSPTFGRGKSACQNRKRHKIEISFDRTAAAHPPCGDPYAESEQRTCI